MCAPELTHGARRCAHRARSSPRPPDHRAVPGRHVRCSAPLGRPTPTAVLRASPTADSSLDPRGSVSGPKPSTTTLLIIDEAGMAGINPQDPRPTGGNPTRNSSRPCGNNASTGISPVPPTRQQIRGPTSHTPDAPHSVQGTSGSARTNVPNGVPAGRPRPADSTPQSSHRGAPNTRLHSTRRQDRQQHAAESGSSFRSRRRASAARPAPRVLLRAGLAPALLWTGRRHAGAPSGGCSSTRGLYSTSWMRPSKVRCSIISRATSG